MANTVIQLKFSTNTATPPSLNIAEPAYSYTSNTLFIGAPTGQGVIPIGGKLYLDQQQTIYDQVNAAFSAANTGAGVVGAYNQANAAFAEANSKPDYTIIRQPFYSKASDIRLSANAFIGNTSVSVQTVVAGQQVGTYLQYDDHISFDDTDTIFTVLSVANPTAQTSIVVLDKPLDANAFSANTVIYGILGNQYGTVTELVIDGGLQFSLGGGRTANTAILQTNDIVATGAFRQANAAFDTANAAFAAANNVTPQVQPIFNTANAAFIHANNSYNTANLAYSQANTANTIARSAFDSSNTKITSVIASTRLIASGATLNQTTTIDNNAFTANVDSGDIVGNYLATGNRVKIGNTEYTITDVFSPSSSVSSITINGPITEVVSAGAIIYKYASYGNVTNIVVDAGLSIDSVGNSTVVLSSNTAVAAFDKANAAFNRANTSSLSVSLVDDANVFSNNITQVTGLRFDANSGFDVTDLGSGNVKIAMNSTFKFWKIAGQQDLIANGLDTIAFVGSNGVSITSNTLSIPKSITFDTRSLFDKTNAAYDQANTNKANLVNSGFTAQLHSNGAFALPGNLIFGPSKGRITNEGDGLLLIRANGQSGNTGVYLDNAGQAVLYGKTSVLIQTNQGLFDSPTKSFTFNQDGTFTFPDTTKQSTAFTGYGTDNVARDTANASFIWANAAYDQANTKVSKSGDTMTGDLKFGGGGGILNLPTNQIAITANVDNDASGFIAQATGVSTVYANTDVIIQANTGGGTFSQWNFNKDGTVAFPDSTVQSTAFTGYGTDNVARDTSNAAFVIANSAAIAANTPSHVANSAAIAANTPSHVANSGFIQANAAYTRANNSLNANTGGTVTGNLVVVGNVVATVITTSGASGNITGADNIYANTFYAKNVDLFTFVNAAFAVANSAAAGSVDQTARNTANAASIRANNSLDANTGGLVTGNVTFASNVVIQGNLTVLGSAVSLNTSSLSVADTLLFLGANNFTSDIVDIGLVASYNDGANAHTGIIRDPNLKEWLFFKNYTPEVESNNLIDIGHASFAYANVRAGTFKGNVEANSVSILGYNILDYTNAAFAAANNVTPQIQPAFNTANAAFIRANNTINANTGGTVTGNLVVVGNVVATAIIISGSGTGDITGANNIYANAVYASNVDLFTFANAAFNTANSAAAGSVDQTARNTSNASFIQANNAWNTANAAYAAANNVTPQVQPAFNTANAAFIRANNSINANTGGTITGNLVVVGNVVATVITTSGVSGNITGADNIYANTLYAKNVDVLTYINAAFNTANSAAAGSVDQSARNTANASFIHANAAFAAANAASAGSIDQYARNTANAASANTLSLAGIFSGSTAYGYYFDGSTNGVRLPTDSNLAFGSGDFTIEFWMKAGSSQTTYATIMDATSDNTGTGIGVGYNGSGTPSKLNFFGQGGVSSTLSSTTTVTNNVWYHIACVKSGSNGYLFVNGTLEASTSGWSGITAATMSGGQIGRSRYGSGDAGDNTYTGLLSNIRILKGTALYTSSFTPPTIVPTTITNTQLLVTSSTFVDTSNNAFTLTAVDTTPIGSSSDAPFGLTIIGTAVDTFARNQVNAAFAVANSAAAASIDQTARNTANAAFAAANTSSGSAGAYNTANAAFIAANNSTGTNLTQNNSIIAAFNTANAAFAVANSASAGSVDQTARNTSNAAFIRANNTINANTGGTITGNLVVVGNVVATLISTSGSGTGDITGANNIFANTFTTYGASGNITGVNNIYANTVYANSVDLFVFANAAFNTANAATSGSVDQTARNTANAAFTAANTGTGATGAYNQANAAFIAANNSTGTNLTQNNSIIAAFNTANAAYANTLSLAGILTSSGSDSYSYYFDGFNYGIGLPTSNNLVFGSGDFTIEFWMKAGSSQTTYATIMDATTNGTGTGIGIGSAGTVGKINFFGGGGVSPTLTSTTTITNNVWYHVACVKSGSNGYVFINGTLEANTSSWSGLTAGTLSDGRIGRSRYGGGNNSDNTYTGLLANIRIIKGTALYTSGFTAPTVAPTAIANTQLLIASSTVIDTSNNAFTLTGINTIPPVSTSDLPFSGNSSNVVIGTAVDTFARNQVNAAFAVANSAASGSVDQTARNTANAAFTAANTGTGATGAYNTANAAFIRANNSINANTGGTVTGNLVVVGNVIATIISTSGSGTGDITGANNIYANAVFTNNVDIFKFANAAFNTANSATAGSVDQTARNTSNAAFIHANAAFNAANTGTGATGAYNTANAAYTRANNSINANTGGTITGNLVVVGNVVATVITTSGVSGNITGADNIYANTLYAKNVDVLTYINAAFNTANSAASGSVDQTARNTANAAFTAANSSSGSAGAYNQANAAFDTANAAFLAANNASATSAVGAYNHANAAFATANSASVYANGAFSTANSAASAASSAQGTADAALNSASAAQNSADAAYTRANNALNANTGGIITGDLSITGNLSVLGNTFSINAGSIVANDSLIVLGAGNYTSDILDIGLAGHYNDGTNAHTGLIRDSVNKEWYLFKGYTQEINANNNIVTTHSSFRIDTLNANLRSSNVIINSINILPYINSSFIHANSAFVKTNSAFAHANAAFNAANSSSSAAAAFNTANAAFNVANSASANTLSLAGILTGAVGGVTSYYFNGSSQGIRLPTTSNLDFGSGDFTIEFWMNAGSSQQTYAMIADALTVNDKTGIGINQNDGGSLGYLRFRAQSGYAVLATTTYLLDNTWRHIACVKSGSNGYLFVDGVLEASTSAWSGVTGASLSDGQIGRSRYGSGTSGDNTYTGYISNFRILKGTALYTSGFTVPAFTLNAITNTQLLISSGTTVSDSSNNALTFTAQTVLPNSSTTIVPSITANGASNGSIVGTAVDTFARNQANAAFAAANTGGGASSDSYARNTANAAFLHANAAFIAANNSTGTNLTQNNSIIAAFNTANAAFNIANVAYANTLSLAGILISTNSNFTTPTTAPTAIANTQLLIASSTVIDTSNNAFTLTNVSVIPPVSTSDVPFGGAYSYYFNGSTNGLGLPTSNNLNFGSGDFTFEFWMKANPTQQTFATVMDSAQSGAGIGVGIANSGPQPGKINFFGGQSASPTLSGTTTVTNNVWYHIACVKSGSNGYLFVNGTLEASTSAWTGNTVSSFSDGRIGRSRYGGGNDASNAYTGLLANIRFIKGTALYVGNTSNVVIGTAVDTFARNQVNAAFAIANSAASGSVDQTARDTANAAFTAANTGTGATGAYNTANAAFTRANNSINANTGGTITGNLVVVGNVVATIISTSGSGTGDITGANNIFANTFTTYGASGNITGANNIYANTLYAKNIDVLSYINAAFNVANSGGGASSDTFARNQANAAFDHANAAFIAANTGGSAVDQLARNTANAAFITGNAASIQSNSAFNHANSGFITANLGYNLANSIANNTTIAGTANVSNYVQIQTKSDATSYYIVLTGGIAGYSALSGNNGISFTPSTQTLAAQNGSFNQVVTTSSVASIFDTIATTVNLGGAATTLNIGNVGGITNVSGILAVNGLNAIQFTQGAYNTGNAAFVHANSGFTQANSAFIHANSGFIQANSAFHHANSAFDTANSKAYIFYQDTAPATSNAHDLWVNSETGTTYENYGTPSSPIWAEFGPTNSVANTPPATQTYATLNITSALVFSSNQSQVIAYQGYGVDNLARSVANSTAIRANNSLNANNGGTVTANVVVVGNVHANLFITNGSGGDISNANTVFANTVSTGNVIVSTLVITSNLTVTNNVVVNNNATIKANSAVLGNSSISGLLTVGGNANVAGTLNVSSNLFISGISAGYAPNRPAFRITGNGGSIVATSTVAGGFMVVDYNQGNYLNTTTGIFTAPIPGLYQVNLTVRTFNNTNATINQAIIYKNANPIIMIEFGVNTTMNHTGGSTVIKLAAGDTLKFDVAVGQISFDGNDNWSVAYIG